MQPRYYQTDSHDAIIAHARKSLLPQVCVIPTGGGKSIIVANLAKTLHSMTGKKILCTAPNADLVVQNRNKFSGYGYESSIFCASAGKKELNNDVVFGSPLSLLNHARETPENFTGYAAVIIDESDLIGNTVKELIEILKTCNKNIRVIGLTATPYRMGMGYIYQKHYKNGYIEEANKPYFEICTYEVPAHELIEKGYLTKPALGNRELAYDTSKLKLNSTGKWEQSSIDQAFIGRGRLTSKIVADIVDSTKGYNGVIIYASTIQHAYEIIESLPLGLSGIIHSKLSSAQRKQTMSDMANQRIKYVVNVDVLTVGIDWPHVDCIAVLRATESARLFQQIVGRATRLYPGKDFFLVLDYAGNKERHFPDGDIFNPRIKARESRTGEKIPVICPECNHENSFTPRDNDAGYKLSSNGYFVWPDTDDIVVDSEGRTVPSHFGRRCNGLTKLERCSYRWTAKKCTSCGHDNDIAARYCDSCKSEIINPNEQLKLEKEELARKKSEPIQKIDIDDEFKGNKKIKVVMIETIFRKRVTIFLRMADAKQRDQYRFFRDNSSFLPGKTVNFCSQPGSPYYKFISIT